MSDSAQNSPAFVLKPFTSEAEAALRECMRRCDPAAFEAAVQFRKTGNPAYLPVIVIGIIERFVEPDLRGRLKEADDNLRLIEDLSIDSLTMMEIVILVEEALQMSINNDELRTLRTVGDIKAFMDCKVRGLPPPKPTRFLPIEAIASVMPVTAPFLFLNEASVGATGANARYRITGQEFFLQGHFKGNPVMPASIMLEALGQLGVLFLLEGLPVEGAQKVNPAQIFFTGCEGVRAHRVCRPGDELVLSVKLKRNKMPLATLEGHIRVGQERAVLAEEITLTYGLMEVPVVEQAPAVSNQGGPASVDAPAS
jgi:acyl carrier protein